MQICGTSFSFFRQLKTGQTTTSEILGFFAELGIKQVELVDTYISPAEFSAVRGLVLEMALNVASYDLFGDFGRSDRHFRESQVGVVSQGLERAAALGAKRVLVVPGTDVLDARDEDVSMDQARAWYAEGLRNCSPVADRLGLTLMVANLGYQAELCGSTAHVLSIASDVGPNVRTTYDVGNYLMAGEDPEEALRRVVNLVDHVHLKDWQVAPSSTRCLETGGYPSIDGRCFNAVPLGDGVVRLEPVIRILQESGYKGAVAIEYEGIGDSKDAVRRGLDFLRSVISLEGTMA